jgi:hypothetical protein
MKKPVPRPGFTGWEKLRNVRKANTSGAKALMAVAFYGTAKAVP